MAPDFHWTDATEEALRAQAAAFLATFPAEQRRVARFAIDSPERLDWHYVPRARRGIALGSMDARQRAAAHALLRAALSDAGHGKATEIFALEAILGRIEKFSRNRDPDNYSWTVFGAPEDGSGPWGFRVEGHHVSLNFAFAAGGEAVTDAPHRSLAERLIDEFVRNLRTELAEAQRARIREAGLEAIHFAWAGPLEPGRAHYFRMHGPRLLIEHDNTQNDANHVHSVWRDPTRDMGLDILAEHYKSGHHGAP